MNPGINYNLPAADYHAIRALSATGLKKLAVTPAHYAHWLDHPDEPTPAMRIGRLVHLACIEPVLWDASVVVAPIVDRRTKEGKSIWEQFQASNGGKEIVTHDEHQQMLAMRASVRAHPAAGALFKEGASEVSLFATDESTGALCKSRLDWLKTGQIVDLKTTEDASPAGFARSVHNYGYHLQAAHYVAMAKAVGLGSLDFILVAVEKTAPHAVACYKLDPSDILLADAERRRLMQLHASCTEFKSWPAYSREVETLTLPNWAKTKAA